MSRENEIFLLFSAYKKTSTDWYNNDNLFHHHLHFVKVTACAHMNVAHLVIGIGVIKGPITLASK